MGRNGWGVAAAGLGLAGLWALLMGLGPPGPQARQTTAGPTPAPDGAELVAALGCGGCHRGLERTGSAAQAAPAFGPEGVPLDPGFVYTYLDDPGRRRPDIAPARMPDFRLSERERLALALFLAGEPDGGEAARTRGEHPDLEVDDGRRLYEALNCASCHAHPEAEPWRDGPDLSREGARVREAWLREYLADPVTVRPSGHRPGLGSRMPDFRLTGAEVDAVTAHLLSLSAPEAVPEAVAAAPTPFRARRTEGLVRDRLSCLGCHALDGEGGRLAPPLDGVAERLQPGFLREMIHRPRQTVPGAAMPTSLFAGERLDEVVRWLAHRQGEWTGGEAVPPLELPGAVGVGPPSGNIAPGRGVSMAGDAALYARWCAHCHGPSGEGDGWNARFLDVVPTPHASDSLMALRPDDTLYDGIHAGAWVLDGSSRMPAFGRTLEPGQIRALVGYIRTLCDCRGPAWSRDGRSGSGGERGREPGPDPGSNGDRSGGP